MPVSCRIKNERFVVSIEDTFGRREMDEVLETLNAASSETVSTMQVTLNGAAPTVGPVDAIAFGDALGRRLFQLGAPAAIVHSNLRQGPHPIYAAIDNNIFLRHTAVGQFDTGGGASDWLELIAARRRAS